MAQKCNMDGVFKPVVGKWKPNILLHLNKGPLRMSELEDCLPEAHPRVLKRQIRSLEVSGIVQKKTYGEVPPRVEYSLTGYGKELAAMLDELIQSAAGHDILRKYDAVAGKADKGTR